MRHPRSESRRPEQLERWAARRNIASRDHRELIGLPEIRAKMEREVFDELQDLAKYEMPKKVLLIERDFSIDAGDLTPTLKVRRRVVEQRMKQEIDALYASTDLEQTPA